MRVQPDAAAVAAVAAGGAGEEHGDEHGRRDRGGSREEETSRHVLPLPAASGRTPGRTGEAGRKGCRYVPPPFFFFTTSIVTDERAVRPSSAVAVTPSVCLPTVRPPTSSVPVSPS